MKATITDIHGEKTGTGGVRFIRVEFRTESGGWAKCDLCRKHDNWARWKPHLEIGVTLTNLKMKDAKTINGDSYPRPWSPTAAPEEEIEEARYIVQDRDGDFVAKVVSGGTETCKNFFDWTPERKKARVFTADDLWARGDAVCLMRQLTMGYGGVTAIQVK